MPKFQRVCGNPHTTCKRTETNTAVAKSTKKRKKEHLNENRIIKQHIGTWKHRKIKINKKPNESKERQQKNKNK